MSATCEAIVANTRSCLRQAQFDLDGKQLCLLHAASTALELAIRRGEAKCIKQTARERPDMTGIKETEDDAKVAEDIVDQIRDLTPVGPADGWEFDMRRPDAIALVISAIRKSRQGRPV